MVKKDEPTAAQLFERGLKKILSVPKTEVERREKEAKKRRSAPKPSPQPELQGGPSDRG